MSVPTYLLVDGENIDATLGMSVLGRRPEPEERPRWDRVLAYCDELSSADAAEGEGDEARALFFLNATSGHMPMSFIQALLAMDYRPVPLAGSGSNDEKVVDIGIQRTLEALAERVEAGQDAHVLLGSHDGDYIPHIERLLQAGATVGILCFREFLNAQLAALEGEGLTVYDLESDVKAFTIPLRRGRRGATGVAAPPHVTARLTGESPAIAPVHVAATQPPVLWEFQDFLGLQLV